MTLSIPVPRRSWFLRLHSVVISACLFLFVLGTNWFTFDRFGSDLPDWDQWDAEATDLLRPWFEHDHFVAHLFKPHNEHRIILSKLQNLAVVLLTGQWDSRVESFFNDFLHAAIAVALWEMGRRWLARYLQPAYYVLIGALYGLPLAWQNLLGGFHSQQYWLILTALGAIALLPFSRAGTATWWLGFISGVLALGSMASGLLAAAVVVGIIAWRCLQNARSAGQRNNAPGNEASIAPAVTATAAASQLRQGANLVTAEDAASSPRSLGPDRPNPRGGPTAALPRATIWTTLALMTALITVGATTQVEVPYHEPLKAKVAHDFLLNLLRSLAWPVEAHDWTGLILWAPWAILLATAIRRLFARPAPPTSRAEFTVIALGGWVFVQLLATAYARGAGGDYPASRYMDTLIFSTAANGLALAWLIGRGFRSKDATAAATTAALCRDQPTSEIQMAPVNLGDCSAVASSGKNQGITPLLHWALAAAWLACLVFGLHELYDRNVRHELVDTRNYYRGCEVNVRSYLTSNNPADLNDAEHVPYPSADGLRERLSHPDIRALMTSTVRPALPIKADNSAATNFIENNSIHPQPGTRSAMGAAPGTPELTGWMTWGSYTKLGVAATGEWRSAAIRPPRTAWLRLETAGDLGRPGVSLQLRDASTGAPIADIEPSQVPGDSWRTAYVRSPRRPFVIVATDQDPHRWLAFSAPVEMPALSHLAWWLMKSGLFMAELAAGMALVIALAGAVGPGRFISNPEGTRE